MIGNPAYPTYQVFLSIAVAAAITCLAMPFFIRLMKKDGIGQQIRADGPQSHLVKQGTPTMGGVIMLAGVVITVALFAKWTPDLILAVLAMLITGSLGLLDDIESVAHKRSLGLTPSQKMAGLITISVVFCLAAVNWVGIDAIVRFPGGAAIDLGVLTTTLPIAGGIQIPWLYLVFVFFLIFAGIILDKMGVRFTAVLSGVVMVLGAAINWYAVTDLFDASSAKTFMDNTLNLPQAWWNVTPWYDGMPASAKLSAIGFMIFGCGAEMAGITVSRGIVKWFTGHEMALAMGIEMAIARIGVAVVMLGSPFLASINPISVSRPVAASLPQRLQAYQDMDFS